MTSKIFIRLDHISKDYFLPITAESFITNAVKNSALSSPVIRITTTYPSGVNKETLLLLSLFGFTIMSLINWYIIIL